MSIKVLVEIKAVRDGREVSRVVRFREQSSRGVTNLSLRPARGGHVTHSGRRTLKFESPHARTKGRGWDAQQSGCAAMTGDSPMAAI